MARLPRLQYLASPYSKYTRGLQAAYQLACANVALLLKAGVPVFSPIAHTHGPAEYGGIDPRDHDFWMRADSPFMELCSGLIVLRADGWKESRGVTAELKYFRHSAKPVIWMEPGILPIEFR